MKAEMDRQPFAAGLPLAGRHRFVSDEQVVEPAGAAGVAALLEHPGVFEPPVVAVLSGGNIDPTLLTEILQTESYTG